MLTLLDMSMKVSGAHQTVTLGAVSYSPSTPVGGARYLLVQAIAQNVRYTLSPDQEPTASIGFQLAAAATPILIPVGNCQPRFFREAAGAILQYQWIW